MNKISNLNKMIHRAQYLAIQGEGLLSFNYAFIKNVIFKLYE